MRIFVAVMAFSMCLAGCGGDGELKRENAELRRAISQLEEEAARSAELMALRDGTSSESTDGLKEALFECERRLAKCEKDPFTGTKYLAGEAAFGETSEPGERN